MAGTAHALTSQVLRWSAVAIVVGLGIRTAGRLHESAELTRLSRPLQRTPVQPSLRLLVVGDSTAVGTGATVPEASVAGLLGLAFPRLQIDNRARDGAKLVSLFREAADDPFVQRPELNAADGLHPSDAGYRVWFDELMAQASLPQRLSAALDPDR